MSFLIGSFNFFDISEFPDQARQNVALEVRPGVEGHALWLTGARGVPIQVFSYRDFLTFADALVAFDLYRQSIGASVNVTWAGANLPYQFDILNVVQVPGGIKRLALGVGGINGLSGALLICQWTLIPNLVART